jgi:hypothetical protein
MPTPKSHQKGSKHFRQYKRLSGSFAEQVKAFDGGEQQGTSVLSSVGNILQRIPLLTGATEGTDSNVLGVLRNHPGSGELLLQKHFQELEKLMEYLPMVMAVLKDTVETMQEIVHEGFETLPEFEEIEENLETGDLG